MYFFIDMSIENIIENSCEIVGNYFIVEQERRDDDNKKKCWKI